MSEPIVFVTTMQIHEGELEQFKEASSKAMAYAEQNAPHLAQGVYVDEGEMRAHGLQVHRDSGSILSWWKMGDPHIKDVMQHITTTRVDVYGQPNDGVMEGMRRLSGEGTTLTVTPRLTGFFRL